MDKTYYSLLICDHGPQGINVFANGLQLGKIVEDGSGPRFEPEKLFEKRNPFKTIPQLSEAFVQVAHALDALHNKQCAERGVTP